MQDEEGRDHSVPSEEKSGIEGDRPNWFVRAKIPLWLALPIILVSVLFAIFLGYPQRSVSSAVTKLFGGTENVEISYCLSNEAAKDPDRWKAEERFKEELKNLGVRNIEIRFVSPCPSQPALSGSPKSQVSPEAPRVPST